MLELLSTVWGPWESFYQANVLGTQHVLEACRTNKIRRLVYVSSPSIYAAPKDQIDIKEEDAPAENHLNNYIKSKLLSEKLFPAYPDVPSIILRPRGLFGVGDTSILPRVLKLSQKIGIPFNQGRQAIDGHDLCRKCCLGHRFGSEKQIRQKARFTILPTASRLPLRN